MIRSQFRLLLFLWASALAAWSAPLERSLGQGLVYLRARETPGDLAPRPLGRVPACVLDLRFGRGDAAAAEATKAWLDNRATARAPVFVLANAETSRALLKMLQRYERGRRVLVVGPSVAGLNPDIEVNPSSEHERRAYDALEQGVPVAVLLTDNPDKVRNDEASLSKDRLAAASAEAATDAAKGGPLPPPVDLALQRAVHLHRALIALRKI